MSDVDRFEYVLDRVEEIEREGQKALRCLQHGHVIRVPSAVFDAPGVTTHAHCAECDKTREWDGPAELN